MDEDQQDKPDVEVVDIEELDDGTTEHDETDVPVVIDEHHGDGPGNLAELGESDFEGFPEPGVQSEEDDK